MDVKWLRGAIAVIVVLSSSVLYAQTGPDLLIKPWSDTARTFEVGGDALVLDKGYSKKSDHDFTLSQYEVEGRFRIIPGEVISPRVGFDYKLFDLGGSVPELPKQLTDESIALGAGIYKEGGLILAVKGGIGYAGPDPFTDGNAFYGLFDFIIGYDIDENSQIGFVLDYNGNRSSYRDVPLPGFAYRFWQYNHQVLVALGFPYTSIEFHPTKQIKLEATYSIPDDLQLFGSYEIIPHCSVYGSLSRTINTFYLDTTQNVQDRLYFQQRRAELGVQYSPRPDFDFRLAVGYAWDQEFSIGFSSSNTDLLADISDEPYVRAGIVWKY